LKTVFVNRFFYPDHSATSQLLTELALELAELGREIHVVTSRQLYEEAAARLPAEANVRGVRIHRVWTARFGRGSLIGRAVDYFTFYGSALFCLLRLLERGDVVVAKTDPPLISLVAGAAARVRRASLVNWLQDVFPEVADRLGMKVMKGLPGHIVKALRNRTLRQARVNVVLGERMAEVIHPIAPNPRVIHNWAVGNAIRPLELHDSELRRTWSLQDRFVVGYSGNLGRAHEFDTIVDAIEAFREDDEVMFLFIGGGKQLRDLRHEVERRLLTSRVMFQPYQPVERLAHSLGAANVHLVTLQPSLEGLIVPSKFYGIAAAARPTLFVGDVDGEIPRILKRFQCGYAVATGDATGLVACIRELRANPERSLSYGLNARRALEEYFDRSIAVAEWAALLDEAAAKGGGSAAVPESKRYA
jgi:colanic acid biosynthesis glycosyl transferase WcaI